MEIKWIDLQNHIKLIFHDDKVKKFKDILEKDKNGYNWILNFYDLRTDRSLIIYTKFIFKLTENKEFVRKNEFLYLKDLNCIYKIIKFDSLGELENIIKEIINQNLFGRNLLKLSEFLLEPEININNYFDKNNIDGYSVFTFEYIPDDNIIPCQNMKFKFKFNVNNNQDVVLIIKKENKDGFKYIFNYSGKKYETEQKDLENIIEVISEFIKKELKNI